VKVLTAESMRHLDRRAIEEIGIPGLVLMENAAIGVADAVDECFPEVEVVVVVCGPGNNGADGLAVARHLWARGVEVQAVLIDGGGKRSEDCERQLKICRNLGVSVFEAAPDVAVETVTERAASAEVVVDALFGVGLSRPLDGVFSRVVEALTEAPVPSIAVDLPSGLHGSRSSIDGPFLPAHATVTFAAPKVAHALSPASDAVGELFVVDLGFGPGLTEEAEGELNLSLAVDLVSIVQERSVEGHKGSFGHLLLVAGNRGTSGAAILAARAAGRSGVGLVSVATARDSFDAVERGSVESMTLERPALSGSGASGISSSDRESLGISRKSALALGPGVGTDSVSAELLRCLAMETDLPTLLDADALTAFAGRAADLVARRGETVLTPHPGEISRLTDGEVPRTSEERLRAARELAEQSAAVVVLKGHQTLIAEPDGRVFINTTGNSGMATGGSGDVLTGLIGGLLAQGYGAAVAARLGVFLHGLAGDLSRESGAEEGLVAGDLVLALPLAWKELEKEGDS